MEIEAREELAKWMATEDPRDGERWAYFVTLTFRNARTSVTAARSHLLRFLQGEYLRGGGGARCILWGAESQQRGTAHIHALWGYSPLTYCGECAQCAARPLLSGRPCVEWRCLNEAWWRRHGIARFLRHNGTFGAAAYVAKYVMKHRLSDWGIFLKGVDY